MYNWRYSPKSGPVLRFKWGGVKDTQQPLNEVQTLTECRKSYGASLYKIRFIQKSEKFSWILGNSWKILDSEPFVKVINARRQVFERTIYIFVIYVFDTHVSIILKVL